MNLLQKFVDFLLDQKPKPSLSTIKNYKADIGQFICWVEKEFNLPFDPSRVTTQILQKYKQTRTLSGSSVKRHLSSLRKFFKFLKTQNIVTFNLFPTPDRKEKVEADPWMIRNFKNFLYEYKKSNLTIKNYINDVKSFFVWLEKAALTKYSWNVADKNLLNKINLSTIQEYKQRLITAKFSPTTVNRKLSSLRSYMGWAKSQGLISFDYTSGHTEFITISQPSETPEQTEDSSRGIQDNKTIYSSFPPKRLIQKSMKGINILFDDLFILPLAQTIEATRYLFWKITGKKIFKKTAALKSQKIQPNEISNIKKEFYAPLSVSVHYFPIHKRIWHYIRYIRPNWYKKYHSYSLTHYFHFALLMVLSCTIGFGMYNSFSADTQGENAILGVSTNAPPRILSFQGKLTDSSETPITKETTILFSLYNDESASSEAALWQEEDVVKPDSDGIFSAFLGKKTLIPDTVFSQNSQLFLGISVGNSPELRPRQELATVPFASNAETLQGLEPITNTTKVNNVVLALNSSGNLSIAGSKAHTFQVIGGNFVLSGKVLSLTTVPGSNSNVEITPDGIGKIDLTKPIQNSTNNNNLMSAVGSVEFDDTVAILATTSAQAALYINQNSTGVLISASTSGNAKFVVENDGTGKFTGDLGINGGDLTSYTTTFNLLNSTVTTLNIGGAATALNLGVSGGTTSIKSNLTVDKDFTLPSLISNGGILYTNASGKIFQVSAGSSSDCLMGGTTPFFASCSGTNIFSQTNGAIYAGNTTLDVLFGSSATDSAKFAFINIDSGTPTASISGNLTLNSAGIIRTTNLQTLTIGGDTTGGIGLSPGSATPSLYAANGGNVGIGTIAPGAKFDVVGGQTRIEVSTQYSQRLCHSGTDGTSTQSVLLGDCDGAQADIAEYYGSKDLTIEPGDVVIAAPGAENVGQNSKAYVNKSDSNYQGGLIGIVSTNPYDTFGKNFNKDEYSFPVALIGRVPVKISLENGPIKAGDLLTSSSIPGVAMKATKTGPIVGKALEDLSTINESEAIGFYNPEDKEYRSKANFPDIQKKPNIIPISKIYAFINISWYDPGSYLAQNGDLIISSTGSNGYSVSNSENEISTSVGGFFKVIAGTIKTGLINASEVVTNTLIVTSDSMIINGQNLKDYIVQTVKESGIMNQESEITSPSASVNKLSADVISPLSESLIVRLATPSAEIHHPSFIIQNSSGSAVAKIDDQGNASFSGTINSLSLETNDASISGTLRAGNIIADSITGLEAKISTIYDTNFVNLASYSAQLSYVSDLTAERAQLNQGLMVFGPTSLFDLSVAGSLSIGGTMFVTENSIETLGTDLSLQSLKQGGLSIMSGMIYIDTDGNIKVQGNLSVAGKLAVNVISPLPTSDLIINNASGSSVLSINQIGDVIASGSGTFAKLNLSLIQPVLAVSATEVIASSSAGIANIAPYQSEITIRNALVTNKSVIYITPVGTPSAQTPFLMRQIPEQILPDKIEGSFTVGVQSPTNHSIDFNWLIIN